MTDIPILAGLGCEATKVAACMQRLSDRVTARAAAAAA